MAICLFSSLFMAVAGKWSVGIFVRGEDSAQVLNLASIFLLTQATFYPILGLIFTYRNVLQGIGRTLVPMLAGAAEMVARCAAAFLLVPALGFWGGCVSNPLAWLAADVLLLPMYWWLIKTKEFRQGTPGSSGAG
jgi:Na+-driven multidrug efflux pump